MDVENVVSSLRVFVVNAELEAAKFLVLLNYTDF